MALFCFYGTAVEAAALAGADGMYFGPYASVDECNENCANEGSTSPGTTGTTSSSTTTTTTTTAPVCQPTDCCPCVPEALVLTIVNVISGCPCITTPLSVPLAFNPGDPSCTNAQCWVFSGTLCGHVWKFVLNCETGGAPIGCAAFKLALYCDGGFGVPGFYADSGSCNCGPPFFLEWGNFGSVPVECGCIGAGGSMDITITEP